MNPRNIEQLHVAGRSVRRWAKHDKTWWQPSNRGSKNWHSWHLDIWLQSVHMLRSSSSVFRWWSPAPKTVINIISGWKTELRQFKILRQHLINYLAHARCLCSEPELPSPNILSSCVLQRVIICQFVTEHSNYINTNKWTTMGLV